MAFGTNVLSTFAYTGLAVEVGAGVSGRITPFVGVYGEASYRTGVDDSLAIYKGDVGPRVRW
jgi:hypothetical protein